MRYRPVTLLADPFKTSAPQVVPGQAEPTLKPKVNWSWLVLVVVADVMDDWGKATVARIAGAGGDFSGMANGSAPPPAARSSASSKGVVPSTAVEHSWAAERAWPEPAPLQVARAFPPR